MRAALLRALGTLKGVYLAFLQPAQARFLCFFNRLVQRTLPQRASRHSVKSRFRIVRGLDLQYAWELRLRSQNRFLDGAGKRLFSA